jgi:hypothetical protein
MSWSFDEGLFTDLDRVRFLCGDVDTTDQLVADEVVTGVLSMYGNLFHSSAAVCRHLSARFSRQADISEDDLRKALSQRAKAYSDRAKELDTQASSTGSVMVPTMFAGGISVSDKQTREQDTNRVPPFFSRRTDELPSGRASPTIDVIVIEELE